jgi:nucleotide-binding universal stress UspA family protein
VLDPQLDIDLCAEAKAYLERVAERERAGSDLRITAVVLKGPVVKTLAEYAASLDDGLVVMTTHGRGGIAGAWLGSVTDGLVRSSTVPVLAMRVGEKVPPSALRAEFGRVLLPLADRYFGVEIIDRAVEVAGTDGVEYLLLHVLSPVPIIPPPEAEPIVVPAREEREAAAQEFLDGMASPLKARGIPVRIEVAIDPPAHAILDVVERDGIDLVAMATHGFRGVKRLLLGSVADKVLRSARSPVLLERPPETDDEKARAAAEHAAAAG